MNTTSSRKKVLTDASQQKLPAYRKCLLIVAALALAGDLSAQQVVMAAPQQPLVAPMMRQEVKDVSSVAPESAPNTLGPVYAVGEFQLHPHLFASLVHADGLPVQSGARVTSDIFTFAPGLLADLGQHWTFDYTGTEHTYSAQELRNAFDHDFRLVGANRTPDLGLQFTASYSNTSPILIETAQQTKQKVWAGSLTADHNFGNLFRYQGSAGVSDTDSQGFSKSRDWVTDHWFRTTLSPKTDAGLGLSYGYSDIVAKPNSHYTKYLGEIKWRPADRINVSLQGGWQDWHSLSAAIGSERNPVIQATLDYQPVDQTKISLFDSRLTSNTLDGNGVNKSSSWGASLNQRLLGKLFLRLGYTESSSDYRTTAGASVINRSDTVKSFNTAISIVVFRYWTAAATYQSLKNDSDLAIYKYSSSQYGVEVRGNF